MTLKFFQKNNLESGKSVALKQIEEMNLKQKIFDLRTEIKFLEDVRGRVSAALIEEETDELKNIKLKVEEYKTLSSFIPRLKAEISFLKIDNKKLNEENHELNSSIVKTKAEKEQIREKISALTNVFDEKRKLFDEKIKQKTEDNKTLSHSLAVKKQELDKVCESIQKEKEIMVGEKAEHKAFQKFLERKAADLMRMERKIMVKWNELFPGKPMLYKETRELVDTVEAFVSNESDIKN